MIVVMDLHSTEEQIKKVEERLEELGFSSHLIRGVEKIVIGAVGGNREAARERLELLPGVEKVVPVMAPYKIVSREYQEHGSIVKVGELSIGRGDSSHSRPLRCGEPGDPSQRGAGGGPERCQVPQGGL